MGRTTFIDFTITIKNSQTFITKLPSTNPAWRYVKEPIETTSVRTTRLRKIAQAIQRQNKRRVRRDQYICPVNIVRFAPTYLNAYCWSREERIVPKLRDLNYVLFYPKPIGGVNIEKICFFFVKCSEGMFVDIA